MAEDVGRAVVARPTDNLSSLDLQSNRSRELGFNSLGGVD